MEVATGLFFCFVMYTQVKRIIKEKICRAGLGLLSGDRSECELAVYCTKVYQPLIILRYYIYKWYKKKYRYAWIFISC